MTISLRPLSSHSPLIQIQAEEKDEESEAMRKQLANKKVTCRYCGGDHFTAHCPYKDTLGAALGDGEPRVLRWLTTTSLRALARSAFANIWIRD